LGEIILGSKCLRHGSYNLCEDFVEELQRDIGLYLEREEGLDSLGTSARKEEFVFLPI
jgi:hypothetical protein